MRPNSRVLQQESGSNEVDGPAPEARFHPIVMLPDQCVEVVSLYKEY